MNKPPAFQFYADDFLGGTVTMTLAQRGLYITLLSLQWNQGFVTQDDFDCLVGDGTAIAEPMAKRVLAKFAKGDDGHFRNVRLEAERQKQQAFRASRSESGKAGADKRWHSHSAAIAQPMAKNSSPSPSPNKDIYTAEFQAFWDLYPKKVAKPQAAKAFDRVTKNNTVESVIAGVKSHIGCDSWKKDGGQYIPHPATFLNQERFNDRPQSQVQLPKRKFFQV